MMTGNTMLMRRASGLATTLIALVAVVVLVLVAFAIGTQIGSDRDGDNSNAQQASATNGTDAANSQNNAARQNRNTDGTNNTPAQTNPEPSTSTGGENQQPAGGPPPVDIQPPQFNFGTIGPGDTTNVSTQLFNLSPDPLRIVNARCSYSGATIELTEDTIPPGGSLDLNLTYTATTMLGPKHSAVRVIFDGYDPIDIHIDGEVALAVRAEPGYLNARTEKSGTFSLMSRDGQPFEVLSVNGNEPNFVAYDPESDAPRAQYEIAWDISGLNESTCTMPDGRPLRAYWVVETTHPKCPVLDIYIRHACTTPRDTAPGQNWLPDRGRVFVGQVEAGSSMEIEIGLRWLRNAPPTDTLQSASSLNPEQFEATLLRSEGTGADKRYFLRLDFNEEHQGTIYGKVRVQTQRHSREVLITGSAQAGQ